MINVGQRKWARLFRPCHPALARLRGRSPARSPVGSGYELGRCGAPVRKTDPERCAGIVRRLPANRSVLEA